MDLGIGVVKLDQLLHRLFACVNGYGGRVVVQDKAMIRVWLLGPQRKVFICWDAWESLDFARGDVVAIRNLMQIGGHIDLGTFKRRSI